MSFRRLISALYFSVTIVVCAEQAVPQPTANAALVCLLEGEATVVKPGRPSCGLDLFAWLPERSQVCTVKGAHLILVFSTGERWEMVGRAQAKIGKSGLIKEQGDMRELERVPMIPSMAKTKVRSEGRPGAFIVRNEETGTFKQLSPADGCTVLADETELKFQSTLQGVKFLVAVEDEFGKPVFSVETLEPKVSIPSGVLKAGSMYFWCVRRLDGPGLAISAIHGFRTAPGDYAKIREELKAKVNKDPDPSLKALLMEMDRWLGL